MTTPLPTPRQTPRAAKSAPAPLAEFAAVRGEIVHFAAVRGEIVHFLADPASHGAAALEHFPDGILIVRDGKVAALGPAAALLRQLPADLDPLDYRGKLIVPGFVDTHVHYSQTDMIASFGEQLLPWLERYAFPTERRFADGEHAAEVAGFFCDELLRNGTTTASVLATVHPESVDALFAAAEKRRLRLVTGKLLMDRNCPDYLRDGSLTGGFAAKDLIERWHGRSRLRYAVSPRAAFTSSREQMTLAGRLFAAYPDLHLQSHLAENRNEVDRVGKLYPEARSYADVFARFGQFGERALFAHCIWIDDEDRARFAESGTAMSFCPTSNLFLGSGLFDLAAAQEYGIRVGVGTDVGAGTSFSLLQTLNEAYKGLQLQGQKLTAESPFYLATLGGARSLYLAPYIGNFLHGKEADFVVLDPQATPLLARRMANATTLSERLFLLLMLGDDRAVAATHVLGTKV